MIAQKHGPADLRGDGIIQQKQKNLCVMRLHVVGGDLTAAQLHGIAEVSTQYGKGMVHLSTRQGIEIHNVLSENIARARVGLAAANVGMGACGPRIRIIVACPGSSTCRWGLIETKEIARYLDQRYFGKELPHKFKISVTGCPNNCAKAIENDLGIMGGVFSEWHNDTCTHCDSCIYSCPRHAIAREGDRYVVKRADCILCGTCIAVCPASSWTAARRGYTLFIGGTMGKKPRFGTRIQDLIEEKDRLYPLIQKAIGYYRTHGKARERFGHLMDRIGAARVKEEILGGYTGSQHGL